MGTLYIPERVIYFLDRPSSAGLNRHIGGPGTPHFKVRSGMVADPKNASTVANCRKGFSGIEVGLPNDPIPFIRSNELRWRTAGNSFNALIHDHISVDMDNRVVLELLNNGRVENGRIIGPFVWCRINQGLDLVRVGSNYHQIGMQNDGRKTADRIPSKDLLPGHVYKTDDGSELVYLGQVEIDEYSQALNATKLTRKVASGRLWLPEDPSGSYLRHLHIAEKRPIEGPLRKAEMEVPEYLDVLRGKSLDRVEGECQRRLRIINQSKTGASSILSEELYYSRHATWLTVRRKGGPRVEHPRLAQLDALVIEDPSKAGTKGSR